MIFQIIDYTQCTPWLVLRDRVSLTRDVEWADPRLDSVPRGSNLKLKDPVSVY
jgi:hypothetical protein